MIITLFIFLKKVVKGNNWIKGTIVFGMTLYPNKWLPSISNKKVIPRFRSHTKRFDIAKKKWLTVSRLYNSSSPPSHSQRDKFLKITVNHTHIHIHKKPYLLTLDLFRPSFLKDPALPTISSHAPKITFYPNQS